MGGVRCAGCGKPASTVVIELSALLAYLDLCEAHLAELLAGARPIEGPDTEDISTSSLFEDEPAEIPRGRGRWTSP